MSWRMCTLPTRQLLRNNRDAYLLITQSLAPPCLFSSSHGCHESELLPRELCCSVLKGPSLWFATQGFQVNQILGLLLAHTKPPSCFQWRQNRWFLSVYVTPLLFSVSGLSFLQKIKILYLMEWGKHWQFFAEEDNTLVGAKQVIFSSITDKDQWSVDSW